MIRYNAILPSAARNANGNSADFVNEDQGSTGSARFTINVSAVTGTTPSLTVIIEGLDPASGVYVPILTAAAITAVTATPVVLTVGPGLPVTANLSANSIFPRNYRVRYTISGTTPSFTFSVGVDIV